MSQKYGSPFIPPNYSHISPLKGTQQNGHCTSNFRKPACTTLQRRCCVSLHANDLPAGEGLHGCPTRLWNAGKHVQARRISRGSYGCFPKWGYPFYTLKRPPKRVPQFSETVRYGLASLWHIESPAGGYTIDWKNRPMCEGCA